MTLEALARAIGARLVGDASAEVHRVAALDEAGSGEITYCKGRRFRNQLVNTAATAVILAEADLEHCPASALVVDDPYAAYARAARILHPPRPVHPGIHPSAVIDPSAQVADSAEIGPRVVIGPEAHIGDHSIVAAGCVLEEGASIGEGTRLGPNVTIGACCHVGHNCIIHGGVVIGADGFGFAPDQGRWEKIPQIGAVRIGNDCEIGANTCIDRGALHDTVIGNGVKIDNLVQIGHNVTIGDHTIIVACAMIGGSTRIGSHCAVAGGVGLAGHLEIADGTQITGMSMVAHDLPAGRYSSAIEVQDSRTWRKNHARLHRLDETIRKLRQEIAELQKKLDEE
ncbi:MAG: UDP-3-O-(3-hydroxymyristoyl)glucosamine N-acyltransferase [Gammaproteobacteria bacterium]|nr:MAG: UDP-3-O-(3-hydroxymyristoyl)glucosamine N-acyltransferase [Gammaproteobacteria bacterium]